MRAIRLGLVVVSLLALTTKFFTFEATLKDDPTVSLVLRPMPSLENERLLDDSSQLTGALVLAEDENAFWGGGLYSWIVSVGWWLLPLLLIAAWAVPQMRRTTSRA
ncbi:hypothetical protein [Archangium violaceum]|uniref:hypothetical protein n=1 Tax=Archangium violaceum TaxID=83451 RepID=UPI000697A5E7|nr:hypothetical protein [Archangium violaceum]